MDLNTSREGIFVGVNANNNTFLVYLPETSSCVSSAHVKFGPGIPLSPPIIDFNIELQTLTPVEPNPIPDEIVPENPPPEIPEHLAPGEHVPENPPEIPPENLVPPVPDIPLTVDVTASVQRHSTRKSNSYHLTRERTTQANVAAQSFSTDVFFHEETHAVFLESAFAGILTQDDTTASTYISKLLQAPMPNVGKLQ